MITQRYGAIEIGYTTGLTRQWNDKYSGADEDVAFWLPQAEGGFRPLGAIAVNDYSDRNGRQGGLLVRGVHPEAVRSPDDYLPIWSDRGSGARLDGALWRPVPPAGYAALGDLCWPGHDRPPLDAVWCVKRAIEDREYVAQAEISTRQWWDKGSGAPAAVSVWAIEPPRYPATSQQMLMLPAGTFTAHPDYQKPDETPVAHVLSLPSQVTVGDGPTRPVMTGFDPPPAQHRVIDRTVVVPYTLVRDEEKDESWRVTHSPFYTLQRERWYRVVLFRDNKNGTRGTRLRDRGDGRLA